MLAALQNVRPSHLLDRGLWRALGVHAALENDDPTEERNGGVIADAQRRNPGLKRRGWEGCPSDAEAEQCSSGLSAVGDKPLQATVPGVCLRVGRLVAPAAWARGAPALAKFAALFAVLALVAGVVELSACR